MSITANSTGGWHGWRRGARWRSAVSILVAVMVLFSSLQHLICGSEDDVPVARASMVLASNGHAASIPDEGALLPGDCHCICHATSAARPAQTAAPVEFASAGYGLCIEHSPPQAAELPPFKPPRA